MTVAWGGAHGASFAAAAGRPRGRGAAVAVVYRHCAQRTGPRRASPPSASYSTSARAPASPAPPACARSCRRCSRARSRAGTPASTSTARAGSSSRARASCWRVLALAVVSYVAERSGANRRADRARDGACSPLVLGALLFAGSLAAGGESAAGPGSSRAPLCAALAFAGRGRAARARGAPARRRRGGPADRVRRPGGARAGGAGDLRGARRVPRARGVRRPARPRPRAGPARSTPACASCDEPGAGAGNRRSSSWP